MERLTLWWEHMLAWGLAYGGRRPLILSDSQRRRAARRVKPGNGRPLQPFRWWQSFTGRKLFFLPPSERYQRAAVYAVDIHVSGKQAGDEGKAHLYRDGRHLAESKLPALFIVEGGYIEVALSMYGLRRSHFIGDDGSELRLDPDPGSPIGRRLRFDREHPGASRAVAATSIVLLIVGLGLNALQLWEPIARFPPIVERFGLYESPIHLPIWVNITLAVAAGAASVERGLRLRYNPLLDALGT